MRFMIKILVSAIIIAFVSELGKRSTVVASIIASLPLTSILAIIWLYKDTGDIQKVTELSSGIMWAIIPSVLFFVVFPILIKFGFRFWPAIISASIVMSCGYATYSLVLNKTPS